MQHFFPIALPRAATRSACESLIRFDACNVPEPDSLRHLARQLQSNENFGAVIVKFRCINKKRNLLTRFINLESLAFQWIVQAGRWRLLRMATLPGTNYLIRRSLLEKLGEGRLAAEYPADRPVLLHLPPDVDSGRAERGIRRLRSEARACLGQDGALPPDRGKLTRAEAGSKDHSAVSSQGNPPHGVSGQLVGKWRYSEPRPSGSGWK